MSTSLTHPALTHEQALFVVYYCQGGNLASAARRAGYADVMGAQMALEHNGVKAAIKARLTDLFLRDAIKARKALRKRLENDNDPKLQLEAAKTILDRAGFIPPKASEPGRGMIKDPSDMSNTELVAMLGRAEGELAARSRQISAPDASQVADLIG